MNSSRNSFKLTIYGILIFLKIQLDFESKNDEDYKTSAADELIVLPSKKRATKIKKAEAVTKILSRKQRKRLEKIVEKKKKKENVRNCDCQASNSIN